MPYNVAFISLADGSQEIVTYSRPIDTRLSSENPRSSGVRKLSDDESSTPFGDADYDICDDSTFFSDCVSPENLALRKRHSEINSIKRARKSVDYIGKCNDWSNGYFVTLTFNPDVLNSYDYFVCQDAVIKWLDCMRHRYPGMEYLLVFEKHKSGRYHVHALIRGCELRLVPAVNAKTGKHIYMKGKQIFNLSLDEYKLGLTTVSYIENSRAAAQYISKYIGKALGEVPAGCHRYFASRSLNRLEDCRETFFIDDLYYLSNVIDWLHGIADSVHQVFVDVIKTTVTYFKVFSAGPLSGAVAPT